MQKCILVIDDDPGVQYLLSEVLDLEGFRAEFAENGRVALEKLERIVPDLILLDIMMPVMDGHAFWKELRARGLCSNTPVFLLTADVRVQHMVEQMGVVGCITKPFHIRDLIQKMKQAMENAGG